MLLATGVDLIEVKRIARSIERYGDRFLGRIYSEREIDYCRRGRNSAERYAARFAAKEAGAKALGTGMNFGVFWRDLEVTRAPAGSPNLQLWGVAADVARRLGVKTIALSLTHTSDSAIAVVILEG